MYLNESSSLRQECSLEMNQVTCIHLWSCSLLEESESMQTRFLCRETELWEARLFCKWWWVFSSWKWLELVWTKTSRNSCSANTESLALLLCFKGLLKDLNHSNCCCTHMIRLPGLGKTSLEPYLGSWELDLCLDKNVKDCYVHFKVSVGSSLK